MALPLALCKHAGVPSIYRNKVRLSVAVCNSVAAIVLLQGLQSSLIPAVTTRCDNFPKFLLLCAPWPSARKILLLC
ncbi:unnamed protein product [Calypogeia fissa]